MATTVSSAWAKPGKWALDSEEHEAMEVVQQQPKEIDRDGENGQFDFPSLSAAASNKSKKKKAQTLSLAEFNTGKPVGPGAGKAAPTTQTKGLTADEFLFLPTGPRERTAQELERSSSRLGGGFRSYGSGGLHDNGRSRYSGGDDSSNTRWGSSSRVTDEPRRNGGGFNRESGPSRADEIDDWGAAKKSVAAPAFERRERGGFFDSQSKADDSDNWLSKKSFTPSEGQRGGAGRGFESHREKRGEFDMFQKDMSNGEGADSDSWGKRREEGSGSGRPRLVLKPRTQPVGNGDQQQPGLGSTTKSKVSNPFGEARPREEVLAEKGQDSKKIDEQIESMKINDIDSRGPVPNDKLLFGKKSFGTGNRGASPPEDPTERNWRKTESVDAPTPRAGNADEEGGVAEN